MNRKTKRACALLSAALTLSLPLSSVSPLQQTWILHAETQESGALSLLNYSVLNAKGEEVKKWHPGETREVRVLLKHPRLKTSAVLGSSSVQPGDITDAIQAELTHCGFTAAHEAEVILKSRPNQLLKFELVFKDVKWQGQNDRFSFFIEYPHADTQGETETIGISQVVLPEEKKEPEPQPDPVVTPEPEEPPVEEPADEPDPYQYNDSEDPGDVNEEPAVISAAAPNIIIQKYTYGGDSVEAGSTFDLNIQFYNTSKELSVENIVMSVETEEGLSIANSSNTYYFETLPPRNALSQKIAVKALGSDQSTSPTITVNFRYEYVDNNSRIERTSSERIAIPVYQPDRLEITEAALSPEIYAGQETPLSFQYVNKGKGTLYNVALQVEGDMKTLLPVQNLGNFEPGKSGTMDLILTPETAGEHEFKVLITYENANGEEIKREFPYNANVMEAPVWEDPGMPVPSEVEEPQNQGSVWPWIVVILLVIAGGLGFWFWKKKNNNIQKMQTTDWEDYFSDEEDLPEETDPEEMKEKAIDEALGGEAEQHETR